MKKLFFLLAAVTGVTVAQAQKVQEKAVPTAVKNSVLKQFPAAKNIHWDKEKENYEAGFKLNQVDYSILLSSAGNVLETEVAITQDALPAPVKAYLNKNYAGKKPAETAKITDAKGTVTYEAEIGGKDLIFDQAGKFLKINKD